MSGDPTFDELKNAFAGHAKQEHQRLEGIRNIVYGASRYNAANTAMSKKQAKAISRQKFPWEHKDSYNSENVNAEVESFISLFA